MKIIKEDLYAIGFKDELANKQNGILNYHMIQEESNEVFLQICMNDTDIYPVLVVSQYDWDNMNGNITYLPMVNTTDIPSLKAEIETLKRLFVV